MRGNGKELEWNFRMYWIGAEFLNARWWIRALDCNISFRRKRNITLKNCLSDLLIRVRHTNGKISMHVLSALCTPLLVDHKQFLSHIYFNRLKKTPPEQSEIFCVVQVLRQFYHSFFSWFLYLRSCFLPLRTYIYTFVAVSPTQ